MEIQLFAKDRWSIGCPIIAEQISWFKGKDVATSLEYGNARDALQRHVEPEDKTTYSELAKGVVKPDALSNQQPHEVYINESGLYSLACSSKKPEAKLFKKWITSEVLPAIRRNGYYGRSDVTERAVTELSAQVQVLQTTMATLATGVAVAEQVKELQTVVCALTGRSEVTHVVLSVATPQGKQAEGELLEKGTVCTSAEIEELNDTEGVIKISDWLAGRVDAKHPSTIHKIKDLFCKELKKRKLEQADENKIDVPLMFQQGGARIVYTKCDEDLMGEVFADLKESFDKIAAMDAKLSSNRAAKVRRTVEQPAVRQEPLDRFSSI